MTKKSLSPRSIAVLKLASSVPALLKQGRATVAAMENNPMFTKPNPPLDQVTKSLDALETAEIAVTQTRAPGSVEARDAAKAIVVSDFHLLRAYVQSVADADRANSDKIITSATMHVKLSPARKKSDLAAKAGPVSGSVRLTARSAGPRASYEWQWSTDGKTWQTAPSTLQAHTTITGLPVAVLCSFRVRVVTRTGEGEWGQVITFLVR